MQHDYGTQAVDIRNLCEKLTSVPLRPQQIPTFCLRI
jgi:hypothetical protein